MFKTLYNKRFGTESRPPNETVVTVIMGETIEQRFFDNDHTAYEWAKSFGQPIEDISTFGSNLDLFRSLFERDV